MATPPFTICNGPPFATEGVPYTHQFGPSFGPPPFNYAIFPTDPQPPPGLTMSSSGLLSGTPTLHGSYSFTIIFTNGNSFGPALVVYPFSCPITVLFPTNTAPLGGRPYQVGQPIECNPPNEFDRCLELDEPMLLKIEAKHPCSVPRDLWTVVPWHPEFGSLPKLAVPFKAIHSILTPLPAAGDVQVTKVIVPTGWDGLLTAIFWRYNGINFAEGSGDIFWRVQMNSGVRFVKDLGNVGVTLGSSVTPMPMTEGQQLQSGQEVAILVNVPNVSGGIQTQTSTITAGLLGFYWPKGVPGWTER